MQNHGFVLNVTERLFAMNLDQHIATSVIGYVHVMTPQLIQRNPPLPVKSTLTDGERANILKFAMQQIQAISAKALKDVL